MDPSIVSALSAILGSAIGSSATIATTWITQRHQARPGLIDSEIRKREELYGQFVHECSRLSIDSLDHTLDRPQEVLSAVATLNRMRFTASLPVLKAGDRAIKAIIQQFYEPNLTVEQIREIALGAQEHSLTLFSDECREELAKIQAGHRIHFKFDRHRDVGEL